MSQSYFTAQFGKHQVVRKETFYGAIYTDISLEISVPFLSHSAVVCGINSSEFGVFMNQIMEIDSSFSIQILHKIHYPFMGIIGKNMKLYVDYLKNCTESS